MNKKYFAVALLVFMLFFSNVANAISPLPEENIENVTEVIAVEESLESEASADSDNKSDDMPPELALNIRTSVNALPGKSRQFFYIPKKDGDYQIWMENAQSYNFLIHTDDLENIMVVMPTKDSDLEYINLNLKADIRYDFTFTDVTHITLKQEVLKVLELGSTVSPQQEAYDLHKFIAPESGSYYFSYLAENPQAVMQLYRKDFDNPEPVVGGGDGFFLAKGDFCYIRTKACNTIKAEKINSGNDNTNVSAMSLLSKYIFNEGETVQEDKLNLHKNEGYATVDTDMQKPVLWVAMEADSRNAKVELKNSWYQTIKWQYETMQNDGKKVYVAPVGIGGSDKSRTYYVFVTPESYDTSKQKKYTVSVNPPTGKPENLKAKSSANGISITWDRCPGADGYRIYRADVPTGSGAMPLKPVRSGDTTKHLDDFHLNSGQKYYYYIVPYANKDGKTVTSLKSEIVSAVAK